MRIRRYQKFTFLCTFLMFVLVLCSCAQDASSIVLTDHSSSTTQAKEVCADPPLRSGISDTTVSNQEKTARYVINTSSKKVHLPDCGSVGKISEQNKVICEDTLEHLIASGYSLCQSCLKDAQSTGEVKQNSNLPVDKEISSGDEYYVLNTSTKKIHLPDCSGAQKIAEKNYAETTDPQAALANGYTACKICKPFGS